MDKLSGERAGTAAPLGNSNDMACLYKPQSHRPRYSKVALVGIGGMTAVVEC